MKGRRTLSGTPSGFRLNSHFLGDGPLGPLCPLFDVFTGKGTKGTRRPQVPGASSPRVRHRANANHPFAAPTATFRALRETISHTRRWVRNPRRGSSTPPGSD